MFIVFDLDGTLALTEHREHHIKKDPPDWDAFFEACDKDRPNKKIISLLDRLSADYRVAIEIWSGRNEQVRDKTIKWLADHGLHLGEHYQGLRMRGSTDFRPDHALKLEWAGERKKPDIVFDDRNSVVDAWRSAGIVCCQVAEGNF